MITDLTSPALRAPTVKEDAEALLKEWFEQWFDGASKALGTEDPIEWPLVSFVFGQNRGTQPLDKGASQPVGRSACEINLVLQPTGYRRKGFVGEERMVYSRWNISAWVKAAEDGSGQSRYLSRRVAGLFSALCGNPDALIFPARKGIRSLDPTEPKELQDRDSIHLVHVWAEFRYPILFDQGES